MWSRQLIDVYDLPLPSQLGPNLDLVMRMARVSGRAPPQICADRSFGCQQPDGGVGRVQGDVVVVAEPDEAARRDAADAASARRPVPAVTGWPSAGLTARPEAGNPDHAASGVAGDCGRQALPQLLARKR